MPRERSDNDIWSAVKRNLIRNDNVCLDARSDVIGESDQFTIICFDQRVTGPTERPVLKTILNEGGALLLVGQKSEEAANLDSSISAAPCGGTWSSDRRRFCRHRLQTSTCRFLYLNHLIGICGFECGLSIEEVIAITRPDGSIQSEACHRSVVRSVTVIERSFNDPSSLRSSRRRSSQVLRSRRL
jgi:hypothetical protein